MCVQRMTTSGQAELFFWIKGILFLSTGDALSINEIYQEKY